MYVVLAAIFFLQSSKVRILIILTQSAVEETQPGILSCLLIYTFHLNIYFLLIWFSPLSVTCLLRCIVARYSLLFPCLKVIYIPWILSFFFIHTLREQLWIQCLTQEHFDIEPPSSSYMDRTLNPSNGLLFLLWLTY